MKKSRVGIAVLTILVILACGGVGYYLIDSKIDLDSNSVDIKDSKWCIKLSNLGKAKLSGDASSSNAKIDKNTLNFDAVFNKKDDTVEYGLKIKNCGTVDAYFFSSMVDGIELDDKDKISYIIDGIEEKDIIKANDSVNVKVKAISNVDEKKDYSLKLHFDFTQVD